MIEIRVDGQKLMHTRRVVLLCGLAALLLWIAYLVRDIWLPLLIAFLIAMVLDPLVDRMEARGWSRLKSAALIYTLFFTAFVGVVMWAVPAVVEQTTTISKSIGAYLPMDAAASNDSVMEKRLNRLTDRLHVAPVIRETVTRARSQISAAFMSARSWLGRFAAAAVSNLLWIVIIPLVSFYALKDLHLIYARLLMLVPREHRATAQNFLNEVSAIFVRYLRGLTIVCALNAAATAVVLALFRVPNPIGLGAISGVLYTVPYLGPVLTYAVIGTVSIMSGTPTVPILVVLLVLHSIIFDQIITPRILGQHVGLHPIASIVALLAGGSLLGIVGMILAVPLAATVQSVVVAFVPKLRAPIDIPTGANLHQHVDETTFTSEAREDANVLADAHQGIVDAVDTAEEHERELERTGDAPAPFTEVQRMTNGTQASGQK
jgi:predicted PurR-regulated permease PerM